MILKASQDNGQGFIQTDALDGERNFKSKLALQKGQQDLPGLLSRKQIRSFVPAPTVDLYDFKGNIEFTYDNESTDESAEDLGLT